MQNAALHRRQLRGPYLGAALLALILLFRLDARSHFRLDTSKPHTLAAGLASRCARIDNLVGRDDFVVVQEC